MKNGLKKKVVALLLSASMLLAACGSEAGSSSSKNSSFSGKESSADSSSGRGGSSDDSSSSADSSSGSGRINTDNAFYAAENSYTEFLMDRQRAAMGLSEEELAAFLSFVTSTNEKYFAKGEAGENYLYSPISLYLALALCEELTDEKVSGDLLTALGVKDIKTLESAVDKIVKGISSEKDDKGLTSICRTANSIWSDDQLVLDDEAKKAIEHAAEQMFADIYHTDLQTEEAYEAMNKWVSEKTAGLIKEIPNKPDGETKMILFNALYFKKTWKEEIKKEYTEEKEFTLPSGETVKTDMMRVSPKDNKKYYKTANTVTAPLYYSDGSYCIFIRPNENCDRQAMSEIMKNEMPEIISAYANKQLKSADSVYFTIPKLEYEYKVEDMQKELQALGVNSVFGTKDDPFSPLDGRNDEKLYVSTITQKCKIIMNEEGTEAAAVTQIDMKCNAAFEEPEEIIEMNLDHSYAYVIMSSNNIPLFVGVVENPAK
ncbi:MAG: hypothetical protein IKR27_06375 [Lachnospiraceae bacterium]|nr:hypothetical protein [Lachnospiraceae bacterium]